jgi:hypothetical protein
MGRYEKAPLSIRERGYLFKKLKICLVEGNRSVYQPVFDSQSLTYTEKLSPQAQVRLALGLLK